MCPARCPLAPASVADLRACNFLLALQKAIRLAHADEDVELLLNGQLAALSRELGEILVELLERALLEAAAVALEDDSEAVHAEQHEPVLGVAGADPTGYF